MKKPNSAQLRQLRRDNLTWPITLKKVEPSAWPSLDGSPSRSGAMIVQMWRSRTFVVVQWLEPNGFHRLSVNRTEWDERKRSWREDISWDDLQRLKREAGFGDQAAVEVFPPDAAVVNVANMRHLFLLDRPPPFMW